MKVIILAGGLGTRISEESHLKPKPMITIGEQPILWHIMKYYSSFGFDDFIICCGYKGHMIKEYFTHYHMYQTNTTFDLSDGGHTDHGTRLQKQSDLWKQHHKFTAGGFVMICVGIDASKDKHDCFIFSSEGVVLADG